MVGSVLTGQYELQVEGGLQGALKFTIFGTLVVGAAHFAWPGFRRQTLALKGFLVSSGESAATSALYPAAGEDSGISWRGSKDTGKGGTWGSKSGSDDGTRDREEGSSYCDVSQRGRRGQEREGRRQDVKPARDGSRRGCTRSWSSARNGGWPVKQKPDSSPLVEADGVRLLAFSAGSDFGTAGDRFETNQDGCSILGSSTRPCSMSITSASRVAAYGLLDAGASSHPRASPLPRGPADCLASIFGLVIGADNHLLKYEAEFRKSENAARRKAINALAMEGRVASEMEIKQWRESHGDRQARDTSPSVEPSKT